MLKLINEIKDDCHCLSVKDVDDLQRTIQCELYCQQIKSFRDHVDNAMPEAEGSENDWDEFYDLDWTIMFGGKAVTIHNEATVYNGILDMLKDFVDNCL